MPVLEYAAWKVESLAKIEEAEHTTGKGDRFVQLVLRNRYALSEDDAINATECAGGGDHGADAIHIVEAGDGLPPSAIVMQGKYGTAGEQFSPYGEFKKFKNALSRALDEAELTAAITQCASVLRTGGLVQYIVATVDPLSQALESEMDDIRVLAQASFPDRVTVEAVSLVDIYQEITGPRPVGPSIQLVCHGVEVAPSIYIGAATLVDVYRMLREYTREHGGVLDTIYDRNVRKWLGGRARSVNAGIAETLRNQPDRFVAYNNGITIVCLGYSGTDGTLSIESPQIVNGCQTTRTLYDFMENHFAGIRDHLDSRDEAMPYRQAMLPFKLIAVHSLDEGFVKDITRYSNKQNAVRGRDFLTLEDVFHQLKARLQDRGYYLEVQTGEYGVLPKAERERFPKDRLINAFDALRFYGAGVLARPHTAFGRSGDFTPIGREFDTIMDGLTEEDLLLPWLVAKHAEHMGYSVGAKWHVTGEDHRNQTRYFFLYCFFRVAAQLVRGTPQLDHATRHTLYHDLLRLRERAGDDSDASGPFNDILKTADIIVATYMSLAQYHNWYVDRNAFLKREDLLQEERLLLASTAALLEKDRLSKEIQAALRP